MNYFELFDLPFRASIDHTGVQKKYIQLQKKFHPDFYTKLSHDEQEDAENQSAHINKAYGIFKDKNKTLEYFLRQKEIIEHDEKFNLPNDFLMEMLEINEAITEKENAAELVNEWQQKLEDEVSDILKSQDHIDYSAEDLSRLKTYYYKKKYLLRILDRLAD
ncbi:MAG TPA: iron-sulfur cluster co-chaperone HscB C-terminal domain-containing protein [Ferruginibacter sp.]|mgnify:FL=1|nr:DnaJ domain-containing protein [Chitinophagaceae bacterium]HAZ93405.1 hypothetical protein [Chitinophagaceae bacterium]HPA21717.1 iron-sulfur cluster co-chaperone HscB C-terminal domain-containing protein [Ferruginibacter sp.]